MKYLPAFFVFCGRCKTPLTQRDLFLIVGEAQVRSHELWLYQVLTRAYAQAETRLRCTSCGEEELSKVKLSELGSLKLRDGESASLTEA